MRLSATPVKLIILILASAFVVTILFLAFQPRPTSAPAAVIAAVTLTGQTQASSTLPATPLSSPTATKVSTAAPTAIPPPTATDTPAPPESYYITDIMGHRQYFKLGCETSAAVDWAEYFGFIINEFEFQHKLPLSDNPDVGFVGNVDSPWGQVPPYAYGVHAYPVANLLRTYGLRATGVKGWTLEQVKMELAQGQPMIAWVIGNMVGGVPYEYVDQNGITVTVAAYEHVVILTGYDATSVRYLNNGRFYDIPNEYFLNSWGVLGNMVLYWED